MNENTVLEVHTLLDATQILLAAGNTTLADSLITEAKKKLRPIGAGSNGPEPKNP